MRKDDKTGPDDTERADTNDASGSQSAVASAFGGVLITGSNVANNFTGGPGDDTLIGRGGPDTLDGAGGDDDILGGPGRDIISGGTGSDTIFAGSGNDLIDVDGNDNLVSAGPGADTIIGSTGEDRLEGDGQNDSIFAGAGRDFLSGGSGGDTLDGGDGDDTLFGDPGNDLLIGNGGDDLISGAGGDDTLLGGAGADTLIGGGGMDSFADLTPGDSIVGGAGGAFDLDILDLSAATSDGGGFRIVNISPDSDGNGLDGEVIFTDADGAVQGALTFENIEIFIPCFTPGTLIATEHGMRRVDGLRAGERIITRDNGLQELSWIGTKTVDAATLAIHPGLRPVLIRAGALGPNLPERDMLVSPNHRMLMTGHQPALWFQEAEVLAAAHHLVNGHSILRTSPKRATYVHIMFERHEVVLSDGTWSESFQPGPQVLDAPNDPQRDELLALFPDLATEDGLERYIPSRASLKRHEAALFSHKRTMS